MNRSLATLAAALLVGSSLAGCSTTTGPRTAAPASDRSATATKPNTSTASMAASMDAQIRDAQNLRAKGDYAGATQILSQLMLVAPDNARVVGEYGKNLVQQGRSKESLDFLKRAVQLQPGDWTLYSATGVAYDLTGDYANAKLAYQQALAIKPGDAGVLNNYALSRMQAKDLSGARQLMTQASATGGSDPKIAQNIALLASLTPTPTAAPVTAKPTAPVAAKPAQEATAKPAAYRQAPPKSLGPNVVIQSVPKDPLAGPVKQATAAPHKLAQDATDAKTPAAVTKPKTADLTPTNANPAPVAAKPAQEAAAKPAAYHQAPPKSLGPNVVMQSVPKDPLAGPVKQATSARHKLAQDAADVKTPAVAATAKTADVAPRKLVPDTSDVKKPIVAAPKPTETATSKQTPVAVDAKKPAVATTTKSADAATGKPVASDANKPAGVATTAKTADAAPHKLVPDSSDVKKPAAATPKAADVATGKPVAADAKKPAPKAADAASAKPAPANNTPSLRMTADAATP